jgi:hypothetical protein
MVEELAVEMFMNKKVILSDEKWLWDLALLYDISHFLNDLYT